MNTIRTAILKAADRFDSGAREFSFANSTTPKERGSACYIGEVAFQLGHPAGLFCGAGISDGICPEIFGVSFKVWTARMSELYVRPPLSTVPWNTDGPHNGQLLRAYADLYHPATPVLFPDWRAMASQQTVAADAVDQFARCA